MFSSFIRYSFFRFESIRESTFAGSSFQDPKSYSSAGFYYTGFENAVACFSCGLVLNYESALTVTPLMRHRVNYRNCRFLLGVDVSIPTPVEDFNTLHRALETQSYLPPTQFRAHECNPSDHLSLFHHETIECPPEQVAVGILPGTTAEEVVVPITIHVRIPAGSPRFIIDSKHLFVLLRCETERLKTFNTGGWIQETPSKEQLAKAGFYHLQIPGYTQCVFCLLVVTIWAKDDPMVYHKAANPHCPYIKGDACGNIPAKESFDRKTVCVVCLERERKVVFIPCKHFVCCETCCTENEFKSCPLCRTDVRRKENVFFS